MHFAHQGDDAWKVLMMDTINGVSLKKTSAKLSLSIGTVFSMRHRFLCSLEKHADNETIGSTSEENILRYMERQKDCQL